MAGARAHSGGYSSGFGRRSAVGSNGPSWKKSLQKANSKASDDSPSLGESIAETCFPENDSSTDGRHVSGVPWAFVKAVVLGLAMWLALVALCFDSSRAPMMQFQFYKIFLGVFLAMTIVPMLAIPTLILARIVSLFRVPHGFAEAIVGGLLGSVFLLPDLTMGITPPIVAWCGVPAGLAGGFVYWRARGYPGLDRKGSRSADWSWNLLQKWL